MAKSCETCARVRLLIEHQSDLPQDYEDDFPGTEFSNALERVLRGETVEVEAWVGPGVKGKIII